MSVRRAQLSLSFDDDIELYDELIAPLKANKELSSLVKRMLSMYQYNENFRNMVISDEAKGYDNIIAKYDEYFKDIHINLMQMASNEDEQDQILKDGISHLSSMAEKRTDVDEEVWGEAIPRYSRALEATAGKLPDSPRTEDIEERLVKFEENINSIVEEKVTSAVESILARFQNAVPVVQPVATNANIQSVPLQQVNHQMDMSGITIQNQSIPTQQVTPNVYVQPQAVQPIQQSVQPMAQQVVQPQMVQPQVVQPQAVPQEVTPPQVAQRIEDIQPMRVQSANPEQTNQGQNNSVPNKSKLNKLKASLGGM